jgi:uncharacterized protein (DUF2345 family)
MRQVICSHAPQGLLQKWAVHVHVGDAQAGRAHPRIALWADIQRRHHHRLARSHTESHFSNQSEELQSTAADYADQVTNWRTHKLCTDSGRQKDLDCSPSHPFS